jgi:hypothetical protein
MLSLSKNYGRLKFLELRILKGKNVNGISLFGI